MDEVPAFPSDRTVDFSSMVCSRGPLLHCGVNGASLLRSDWCGVSDRQGGSGVQAGKQQIR